MTTLAVIEPVVKFHLSLNVADLNRSVAFYKVFFGREPAKCHPDYAKFEIDDPPVVFSLTPHPAGSGGSLSHLGFRVSGAEDVIAAQERLTAAGVCCQDQKGATCGYARQDKVWVTDPDGNFWEIYHVEEDVEPALVRKSVEGVAARVEVSGPVVWEHYVTQAFEGAIPHADGSVDEARLTGTFNAGIDDATRAMVVREAMRVLKPGGKVITHGLMSDAPLTGERPKLPGLAAMVSRVPARGEVVAALRAGGFVQVQATKLTESPWFVHEGVGLREVKFVAIKPFAEAGEREILYKGPFAEVRVDGGLVLRRGERVAVAAGVWRQLRTGAAAEQFLFYKAGEASACVR